jgi:hypothetical protein
MREPESPPDSEEELTLFHKTRLTGLDYISHPITELKKHKDFSAHAMRVMFAILEMNTHELEQLTIARGPQ